MITRHNQSELFSFYNKPMLFKKKNTFQKRKPGQFPKDWFQVSFADFIEMQRLANVYNSIELQQRVVEYYTGIAVEKTNLYSDTKFRTLTKPLLFLNEPPSTIWQKSIRIEGIEYFCSYKKADVTLWQTAQIQGLTGDYLPNLAKIAAVFFVPKGDQAYTNYDARCKVFEEKMPAGVLLPLATFFLNLLEKLLTATKTYLTMKGTTPPNGLPKSGDGTIQ